MEKEKNIVLIEDNRSIMDVLSMLIRCYFEELPSIFCQLHCFFSADDFLRVGINFIPDLILSDVNMPGKSGLELLGELRQKFFLSKYIIMSANRENKELAIALGADYFLEKPFKNEEIQKIMKMII